MKNKLWKKAVAVASAIMLAFSFAACSEPLPEGGGDEMYGNLENFYKDFFDDWDDTGSYNEPEIDWTDVYGELGSKDTFIDASLLKSYNHTYGTHIYEAETAVLSGGAKVETNESASGGHNVGYLNGGTSVEFTVYADADCTALFNMSIAVKSGALARDLFYITYSSTNGADGSVDIGRVTLSGNSWTDFNPYNIGEIELKTGKNTITIHSLDKYNLDYVLLIPKADEVTGVPQETPFKPLPAAQWEKVYGSYAIGDYIEGEYLDIFNPAFGAYKLEAENATVIGNGKVNDENSNASGGLYISSFNTGSVSSPVDSHLNLSVFATEDCTVLMKIASTTDSDAKFNRDNTPDDLMTVSLAGRDIEFSNSETVFVGSNGWLQTPNENAICELPLKRGSNVIDIATKVRSSDDSKGFNVDYIALLPVKEDITGITELNIIEGVVAPEDWEDKYGAYEIDEFIDGDGNVFNPADGAFIYEAENMKFGNGLYVETDVPNASGNKQVAGFGSGDRHLAFTFTSSTEYTAMLAVGITGDPTAFDAAQSADKYFSVTQNYLNKSDCSNASVVPGGSGTILQNRICEVKINKGINRIDLTVFALGSAEVMCLDYVALLPISSDISVEGFETPPAKWNKVYGSYVKYVNGYENAFDPADGAFIFEAENATLGEGLKIESNKSNASGKQQLGGFGNYQRTLTIEFESTVEYTAMLSLCVTGNANFTQMEFVDSFMTITCNGEDTVNCSRSKINPGDWNNNVYAENYIGEAHIKEGRNTIVFVFDKMSGSNCFCLDYILLSAKQADKVTPNFAYTGTALKVEAEDCDIYNCKAEGGVSGVTSGGNLGYVASGTAVKFAVTVEEDCEVEFSINAALAAALGGVDWSKRMEITVGGKTCTLSGDTSTPDLDGKKWYQVYESYGICTMQLKAGRNEIVINMLVDNVNMDYFEFISV